MIVYHGSDSNFKHLKISSSLVKRRSTVENEGYGIYFSTNKETARSYGKYIYTLEINDSCFLDFRDKKVCNKYIQQIRNYIMEKTNLDICKYIDVQNIINRMQWGGLAISGTCHEIYLWLYCSEQWNKLPEYKIKRVNSILRAYDKRELKAYMFKHTIENIGVIKKTDDNIVKIIKKENSY